MISKTKTSFFSFFIFSLLLDTILSTKPLVTQTLTLHSLPQQQQPTLHPESYWSQNQPQLQSETTQDELTVTLAHRDALAVNATPESLFILRLERDSVRVKALNKRVLEEVHMNRGGYRRSNNGTMSRVPSSRTRKSQKSPADFSSSVTSGLSQGSGEYFTRIGIGSPPKYVYMVLDTGSDIVWLQCSPCKKCYSQTDPIFNPRRSSTFKGVYCNDPLCKSLDISGCNRRNSCLYQVSYGDGSFTVGEFSTETLTFRGTKVANIGFGCGHDNEGLFVGAGGLLGLGRGKLGFPTQAGGQFGNKFSYCLVDRTSGAETKPSSIMFGESAVSKRAVFTPMVRNPKMDTYYYLELVGLSVGGVNVAGITSSLFKLDAAGNGGVILDCGTSVTRLTRSAYVALRDAFKAGTRNLESAPSFSLFDTCYDLSGQTSVKVPTVVMHFGGGANVALPAPNYLIPVNSKGLYCFAFAGTASGLSIIGNIQQQGFRVVFDNAGGRIGFAAKECA